MPWRASSSPMPRARWLGLLRRQDDGAERPVRCRTVVLSASACESTRLLLDSRSSRHPNGLANSHGIVGKYLTDSPLVSA